MRKLVANIVQVFLRSFGSKVLKQSVPVFIYFDIYMCQCYCGVIVFFYGV